MVCCWISHRLLRPRLGFCLGNRCPLISIRALCEGNSFRISMGLADNPLFRDVGAGGSNPLSPTTYLQPEAANKCQAARASASSGPRGRTQAPTLSTPIPFSAGIASDPRRKPRTAEGRNPLSPTTPSFCLRAQRAYKSWRSASEASGDPSG